MTAIITSILIAISVLILAFFGYASSVHRVIDSDYMRQVYSNAILYGLQYGELATRAGTMNSGAGNNTKTLSLGYLKKRNEKELDDLNCTVVLDTNQTIDLDIKHTMRP